MVGYFSGSTPLGIHISDIRHNLATIDYLHHSRVMNWSFRTLCFHFQCEKRSNYNIKFADTDDHCQTDPCGSHGTCVDLSDSYHCICDVGYTGYNCNHSICEDNSSPCENNSTCSLCEAGVCNSTGLSFQCDCVDDFYGVLCGDRKQNYFIIQSIIHILVHLVM